MTQSTKDHPAILEERVAYEATIAHLQRELAEARIERDDAMSLFHAADKQMRANKAERDALIGAAYEAAAKRIEQNETPCSPCYPDSWSHTQLSSYHAGQLDAASSFVNAIRALTPAEATAALDRVKSDARSEGFKAGIAARVGAP